MSSSPAKNVSRWPFVLSRLKTLVSPENVLPFGRVMGAITALLINALENSNELIHFAICHGLCPFHQSAIL
jgi:hypothetical protein